MKRKAHLFFAVLFYGFIAAAGIIWMHYTTPKKIGDLMTIGHPTLTFGLGIGAGLAMALASQLVVKLFSFAKSLEQEFGWLLGNQSYGEIFILAMLSGVAEEILFRGAMQQWVGPIFATFIFALAHPPFNQRLMMWPVFALLVGAVLALECELTKSLIAPILTHAIVNFVNLLRISTKYRLLET